MNVIVTGASKGIGKAIAKIFFDAGAHVLVCARSKQDLSSLQAELSAGQSKGNLEFFPADLSKRDDVFAFADWCLQKFSADVLVNNAGSYLPGNAFDEEEGQMEVMMNTNFYSAYHLSRKIIPSMKAKGNGHIFNICSIASTAAYPGGGSYSISKFAMDGLSKNLRQELRNFGIKVTSVFPGAVMTDSWAGFDNSQQRIMESSDIAAMVYAATQLTPQAVVDEILITPRLGPL